MGWLTDIGDFVSGNKGWLEPVLGGALDLYKESQRSSSNNQVADLMRQQEQRNYDESAANRQSYDNYLQNYNSWRAGEQASRRAAQAAYAAAARQELANKMQAMKKAQKRTKAGYDEAKGYLNPYREAGLSLLPGRTQAGQNAINQANLLMAYMQSPEVMAKLSTKDSMVKQNIPLPSYLKG